MSAEKVMGLYDTDVPANGWNIPLVDRNKIRRSALAKQNLNQNRNRDIEFDLNYLDAKTAEIR